MSWQEELQSLLANLGVELENPQQERKEAKLEESVFVLTHVSRSHPGVFYRLDLIGCAVHLRVFLPSDTGPHKIQIFRVQLAADNPLSHVFALFLTHSEGSVAFQEVEGETTYQLLIALSETMKGLFWKGNLEIMLFPPE